MSIALLIRNISRSSNHIHNNCTIQAIIHNTIKYDCTEDELEYESKCASLYANRFLGYDQDYNSTDEHNKKLKTIQNIITPKFDITIIKSIIS